MDDNMTTVLFLGRNGRDLDYHYLLWDFDTERLTDQEWRDLMTLDAGKIPGHDDKADGEDDIVDPKEQAKVDEANK